MSQANTHATRTHETSRTGRRRHIENNKTQTRSSSARNPGKRHMAPQNKMLRSPAIAIPLVQASIQRDASRLVAHVRAPLSHISELHTPSKNDFQPPAVHHETPSQKTELRIWDLFKPSLCTHLPSPGIHLHHHRNINRMFILFTISTIDFDVRTRRRDGEKHHGHPLKSRKKTKNKKILLQEPALPISTVCDNPTSSIFRARA